MSQSSTSANDPDCPLTFVLRCCDDEERVGHCIQRVATHLRSLGLRYELLVVDEGSGDNTLAVAALLRASQPELVTLHAAAGAGFVVGAERARGRAVVLYDVRSEAPLSALGYALGKLERGLDVVALGGRFLLFRRTRALRALDSLFTLRRDTHELDRRFVRRTRALGLGVTTMKPRQMGALEWLRAWMPPRPRAFSFRL